MELGYYKAFMPVYIEKKIWSDVTIAGQRRTKQGKIGPLSQWTKDGWDEQKIFNQSCTLFSGTSPTLTISSTVAIDQNKRTGPGASVLWNWQNIKSTQEEYFVSRALPEMISWKAKEIRPSHSRCLVPPTAVKLTIFWGALEKQQ